MKTEMVGVPTVHLNGTSADSLVNQRLEVVESLRDTLNAIGQAWPHGRDYYVQGPNALEEAQDLWQGRVEVLKTMVADITQEALAIQEQGR